MKPSTFYFCLVLLFCNSISTMGQNSFVATHPQTVSHKNYFESTDTIVYSPVCGIDGKSYLNADEAAARGIAEWVPGNCCSYQAVTVEEAGTAWIERIVINDVEVEKQLGKTGYQNQTHQFFDLYTAQQNRLSLDGQSASDACPMTWSIWIDFNENHQFERAELLFAGPQMQEEITVGLPVSLKGELVTRMRVMWAPVDQQIKEGKLVLGEVIDFSVYIQ